MAIRGSRLKARVVDAMTRRDIVAPKALDGAPWPRRAFMARNFHAFKSWWERCHWWNPCRLAPFWRIFAHGCNNSKYSLSFVKGLLALSTSPHSLHCFSPARPVCKSIPCWYVMAIIQCTFLVFTCQIFSPAHPHHKNHNNSPLFYGTQIFIYLQGKKM